MNIDSNFMQNVRVRAMRAECGSAGVLALIELMCEMFESPEGYWMWWQKMDRVAFASRSGITLKELDAIIERMAEYNIVDEHLLRTHSILTSKFIQSEFRLGFINHDGSRGRYARENFVRRGRSNAGAL